jgi:hypothetical protein
MFAALLDADERIERIMDEHGYVYIHVARGRVSLNGTLLQTGDAAMLTNENHLILDQGQKAEVLVFELW